MPSQFSSSYLGRIAFATALQKQDAVVAACGRGEVGSVLGFESEPVVTLGLRSNVEQDIIVSRSALTAAGFSLMNLDRGGQATLHNPGQLVIFPVLSVRPHGAKSWVCALAKATCACLEEWGIEARWDLAKPGVYTTRGKIASLGVRIRQGISTHGVAINVHNPLGDFAYIRACGVERAALDRMNVQASLDQIFDSWLRHFETLWPGS